MENYVNINGTTAETYRFTQTYDFDDEDSVDNDNLKKKSFKECLVGFQNCYVNAEFVTPSCNKKIVGSLEFVGEDYLLFKEKCGVRTVVKLENLLSFSVY